MEHTAKSVTNIILKNQKDIKRKLSMTNGAKKIGSAHAFPIAVLKIF